MTLLPLRCCAIDDGRVGHPRADWLVVLVGRLDRPICLGPRGFQGAISLLCIFAMRTMSGRMGQGKKWAVAVVVRWKVARVSGWYSGAGQSGCRAQGARSCCRAWSMLEGMSAPPETAQWLRTSRWVSWKRMGSGEVGRPAGFFDACWAGYLLAAVRTRFAARRMLCLHRSPTQSQISCRTSLCRRRWPFRPGCERAGASAGIADGIT